jgi:hypothetical protein
MRGRKVGERVFVECGRFFEVGRSVLVSDGWLKKADYRLVVKTCWKALRVEACLEVSYTAKVMCLKARA